RSGRASWNEKAPCRHMIFVQVGYRAEEETMTCHRIMRTRASQDKPIVATEGRDHDCDRHNGGTCAGKDDVGCLGCDSIARRVLDGIPWQYRQVSHIGEKVEGDDKNGPERQR